MIEKLIMYWQFPFVRYALVVGVLIAVCSSLLGVTLVLRRLSFIGDGLSHAAFGAMAAASVINLAGNMPIVLAVTVICAVLLLKHGNNSSVKGDAAVAMLSVSSLAVGYMLMNVFSHSANLSGDVCATLFGATSILTLTPSDVWLCVGLSVAVVILFTLFYNKIFALTFDEDFARASGLNTDACNLFVAIIVAVVIVLAMNLVGSLLISALVIFPALSAMRVFRSFKAVTVCAVILSVVCAVLGMLASVLWGTPIGATIVIMDLIAFGLFYVIGALRK